MNRLVTWCVTALLCLAIGSSYLLDGPIDDGAQAVADDLNDARIAAVAAKGE